MHKLIALLCIFFVFILAANAFSQEMQHMFTKGKANGYYIVEIGARGKWGPGDVNAYITGVLDALSETNKELVNKLYPNATYGDIVDAVKKYYAANSTQKNRTVVDVILSGCK